MWKDAETKKSRKLTYDEIKRKLIESLVMNDTIESDELTKKVQEVEDPEKAAEAIHDCESIYEQRRKA